MAWGRRWYVGRSSCCRTGPSRWCSSRDRRGYYGRVGFRAGASGGFLAPSSRIPPAAFQFVALPSYEPWMTGALVYPDVFWEHDAVGLRETAGSSTPT